MALKRTRPQDELDLAKNTLEAVKEVKEAINQIEQPDLSPLVDTLSERLKSLEEEFNSKEYPDVSNELKDILDALNELELNPVINVDTKEPKVNVTQQEVDLKPLIEQVDKVAPAMFNGNQLIRTGGNDTVGLRFSGDNGIITDNIFNNFTTAIDDSGTGNVVSDNIT